jgi:hypothetical protein
LIISIIAHQSNIYNDFCKMNHLHFIHKKMKSGNNQFSGRGRASSYCRLTFRRQNGALPLTENGSYH